MAGFVGKLKHAARIFFGNGPESNVWWSKNKWKFALVVVFYVVVLALLAWIFPA